jgi:hypothetical protein
LFPLAAGSDEVLNSYAADAGGKPKIVIMPILSLKSWRTR